MGIWVRSQDKKAIVNISNLNVGRFEGKVAIWGTVGDITERTGTCFGTYLTEDEAIRVLDDIQQHINFYVDHQEPFPVFQMPVAGFSEIFMPECGSDINHCGFFDINSLDAFMIDPDTKDIIPRCSGYRDCKVAWDRGCR